MHLRWIPSIKPGHSYTEQSQDRRGPRCLDRRQHTSGEPGSRTSRVCGRLTSSSPRSKTLIGVNPRTVMAACFWHPNQSEKLFVRSSSMILFALLSLSLSMLHAQSSNYKALLIGDDAYVNFPRLEGGADQGRPCDVRGPSCSRPGGGQHNSGQRPRSLRILDSPTRFSCEAEG